MIPLLTNDSVTIELDPTLKPEPRDPIKLDHTIKALAYANKLQEHSIVYSTFDAEGYGHVNYLSYLYTCWSDHLVPVLTPDIIWFILLNELNSLVRDNSEKVRGLFTLSNDKIKIVVTTGTPYILPVDVVVNHLRPLIPSGVDTYLPKFTTTTTGARLAHCAAFCEMVSPYYSYGTTLCGFPSIIVKGTIEDWIKVAETWSNLPTELKALDQAWSSRVQNLLLDIGRGYHQQSAEFWRLMFRIENCGSGHSSDVHGWLRKLYRKEPRGLSPRDFPGLAAKVDYEWVDTGQTFSMLQGLFSSKSDGNVLTPEWNTLVFETTK